MADAYDTSGVPQTNENIEVLKFPTEEQKKRLDKYAYFSRLFLGEHYDAFSIKIDSKEYNQAYGKLRYVKANFAGLLAKVCADMLFSEPIKIVVNDGDQEFVDALVKENHLHIQLYESALQNSYKGDALFKLRTGSRYPTADPDDRTLIIEDIIPNIYFPEVNEFNVRASVEEAVLAWTFKRGNAKYLRKEIHEPNRIRNEVYKMENDVIKEKVSVNVTNEKGLTDEVQTKVSRPLLFHIPNWKTGDLYFGISDYYDLDAIFYAINNRLTKTDNILDKHSDPILAVPEGIFDENGRVQRDKLSMVEVPEGVPTRDGKPEYVVWDASLESAFKEVDSLVEMFFMISETSPDILGMGKGQSDSGRALKYKLLRTLAKVARKKLYYDATIKDLIYTAQVMAKEWGIKINGKELQGEPVYPEIVWADGLPKDMVEQVDIETKRVDAGLTTKKDAIIRLDDIDEESAEKMVKEISEEGKINMPKMDLTANPFANVNEKPKETPAKGE